MMKSLQYKFRLQHLEDLEANVEHRSCPDKSLGRGGKEEDDDESWCMSEIQLHGEDESCDMSIYTTITPGGRSNVECGTNNACNEDRTGIIPSTMNNVHSTTTQQQQANAPKIDIRSTKQYRSCGNKWKKNSKTKASMQPPEQFDDEATCSTGCDSFLHLDKDAIIQCEMMALREKDKNRTAIKLVLILYAIFVACFVMVLARIHMDHHHHHQSKKTKPNERETLSPSSASIPPSTPPSSPPVTILFPPSPTQDKTGAFLVPKMSLETLSLHNKRNDSWIAIHGKIYNITGYATHDDVSGFAGKDATNAWIPKLRGSPMGKYVSRENLIGILDGKVHD